MIGVPDCAVLRPAVPCCGVLCAGDQATISYLGAPQLLPLDGRQQALGNFGFVCRWVDCRRVVCVYADTVVAAMGCRGMCRLCLLGAGPTTASTPMGERDGGGGLTGWYVFSCCIECSASAYSDKAKGQSVRQRQ